MKRGEEILFIDLYAGIGGIRFAFENAKAKCIFSSEWNKFSQITYTLLHDDIPHGDIGLIPKEKIPNHNILTAGFPCQPFSLAGVSKKKSSGKLHGFEDPTQGTEFFKIKEILRLKQPEAFLLENVKNLLSHNKRETYRVIEQSLDEVGYDFDKQVLDSKYWLPQHRERTYIVGFRKDLNLKEKLTGIFPCNPIIRIKELGDILELPEEILRKYGNQYTVTNGTWKALKKHKESHRIKGNGFGFSLIMPPFNDKVTRTISARYHKDGAEVLISQGRGKRPRRLTPLEVYRLQGFPTKFEYLFDGENKLIQPVSDLQIYKQLGNSVTVPVVTDIAKNIVNTLTSVFKKSYGYP
jgi:DNA (cytosine-5)-methyltransferase 1